MNSLDQVVNLKVKITNLLDESVSGTIYAFSLKHRVLALKLTPLHNRTQSYQQKELEEACKVINTSFIKSITVLPPFPKKFQRSPEQPGGVPKIDLQRLESTLNQQLSRANSSPSKQASPQPHPGSAGVKRTDSPATRVFEKLSLKLGRDNVQWQPNESILIFKEVAISKPYALNKISNSKRTQSSRYLERVKLALREVWLSDDNSIKGG